MNRMQMPASPAPNRNDLIRDIIGLLRYCGMSDLWVLRRFISAYVKQEVAE